MPQPFLLLAGRCSLLLLSCLGACQSAASDADELQLRQLDATLQALNQSQTNASAKQLDRMAEIADRNGFSDSDILRQAQALRARTRAEVARLHRLRQQPASVSAAADTLRQRLRSYSQYVHPYVPGAVLGLNMKEDPGIQAVAGHRLDDQTFQEYYFGANAGAGRAAMLGWHEQQVLRVERDALTKLVGRMGPMGLFFDKIGPAAVAESQTVRAGEPYRARLFMAAASPDVQHLRLSANGEQFAVDPATGSGQVRFQVPADARPGTAVWQGTMQGTYRGRQVSFPLRVPYKIEAR
ncbi:hypothetical protein ACFST9_12540 [Hymenobacter monticola]|uniref:Gliding motility-associated protein GldM first immunoglobulin-like domain-containing protein n=1 Tax=Hymenobacter monticola TaxID=1705399 RepID=A0ABY4B731_9BACT|nr:hypothetical protein [Hymenobacter monticola]UOE34985.1 hypothetical protein MTP16_04870 [Hymenobacter monticola]